MRKLRRLVVVSVFTMLLAAPASSLAATWNEKPQMIPPGTYTGCVTGATPSQVLQIAIAIGRGPDTNDGNVACWFSLTTTPGGGERSRFRTAAGKVGSQNSSGAPAGAGGAGAPSPTPAAQATTGCQASWRVTAPESASQPTTLSVSYGDGSSETRAIPQGSGFVTFSFSHMYPGNPDGKTYFQWFSILQTEKFNVTSTIHSG